MAEPLTLAGFLAAIAADISAGGVHEVIERWIELWREAAIDPETGLPRNQELAEASKHSLRGALEVLILELAGRLEPDKSWFRRATDWLNQRAASLPAGGWLTSDLFPRSTDPYCRWLEALRRAVRSDPLEALHRRQKFDVTQLLQCLGKGEACLALGPGLADAVLEWARYHATDGLEHPDFESLVRAGWDLPEKPAASKAAPLSQGLADKGVSLQPPPARRITLAQAYCLFFREHLKANPKVFNLFAGETLVRIQRNLDALGRSLAADLQALRDQVARLAQSPPSFATFEAWLTPQLGALNELLAGAKDDLDTLARGQQELKDRQGDILVAITALRTEIARGNPDAQPALDSLTAYLTRFERKLDYLIGGLPIQRFQVPDPPTHDLQLLQPKHRTVQLLGRDTDLASLCAWVESNEPISARLLVGGAGTGKTRLAIELLLRVCAALPAWQAGLLSGEDLRRLVDKTPHGRFQLARAHPVGGGLRAAPGCAAGPLALCPHPQARQRSAAVATPPAGAPAWRLVRGSLAPGRGCDAVRRTRPFPSACTRAAHPAAAGRTASQSTGTNPGKSRFAQPTAAPSTAAGR